jgi:hypothetical protein
MIESLMAEQGANSRLPWIGVVAPSVEGALVAKSKTICARLAAANLMVETSVGKYKMPQLRVSEKFALPLRGSTVSAYQNGILKPKFFISRNERTFSIF